MAAPIADIRRRIRSAAFGAEHVQAWSLDTRVGVRALADTARRLLHSRERELAKFKTMATRERSLWRQGLGLVAGVDEVGAGPLAGPVVAAAIVLPPDIHLPGIDDSKRVPVKRRTELSETLRQVALAFAFGSCSVEEIDRYNILQAARLAMLRAVTTLAVVPDHVLVDARTIPDLRVPQEPIVKGDSKSISIAAASILAKVERDRLMTELASLYPAYGFEEHAGYGTARHLCALRRFGPTPVHRRSFAPVAALLSAESP